MKNQKILCSRIGIVTHQIIYIITKDKSVTKDI